MSDSRRLLVHFACNDYRNGVFQGHCDQVEVCEATIVLDELPMAIFDYGIVIGWRAFPAQFAAEWVGNWCWNAWSMDIPTTRRLLTYLRDWYGTMDSGPEWLYERWHSKDSLWGRKVSA